MTRGQTTARALAGMVASFAALCWTLPGVEAAPVTEPGAAGRATLMGVVTDSTGGVIVGASATLRSPSGDLTRSTATDARGAYGFQNVPAGAYVLDVFRDGFGLATREVVVSADKAVVADVSLEPAGFSEEVSVAFTAPHASSALKLDTPVMDLPVSVKSYTGSFLKAVEAKSVGDVLTYMTGVQPSGTTGDAFAIRGFHSDTSNFQVNGLPGLATRFGSPSALNVERIEVVKGPASVLYGQAQPGGLVNIITKRPLNVRQNLVDLRLSSFAGTGPGFGDRNSYRVAGDFTGPVVSGGTFLYRLIAAYDNSRDFRDSVDAEEIYVVPSLSWQLFSGTALTLEFEYRRDNASLDDGLVAPFDEPSLIAPIITRYQEPDDGLEEEGKTGSLYLTSVFPSGLLWRATWRSVWHDDHRKGLVTQRIEADGLRVRRRDQEQLNKRQYHFLDTNFTSTLKTGSVEHRWLLGLNGGYELRDFDRLRFGNLGFFVRVNDPVYGLYQLPANGRPDTHRIFDFYNYGAYVQDHITFSEKWKALAALRFERQDADFEVVGVAGSARKKTNQAVLPSLGLVFQPSNRWSTYGSFSKSYVPQLATANDAAGQTGENTFDPEEGIQFEVGAKFQSAQEKVDASVALFHIMKKNVLASVAQGVSVQIGEETGKGFEFDVRLQPVNNWQLFFGYAFTDAYVSNDVDPNNVGALTVNSARHAANLWTRYSVAEGALKGLGLGLGWIYRGERAGTLPTPGSVLFGQERFGTSTLFLPAYSTVDAAVYYSVGRYELTFKVKNLLNEIYYESAAGNFRIRPGSPRQLTLSGRVRL